MKNDDIQKKIAHLFTEHYPKCDFNFVTVNNTLFFKSFFNVDKQFIDFQMMDDSITNIRTSNKYLPEVKNLLSINKMKRTDFNIIQDFFSQFLSNENFNKTFTLKLNLKINELFSFKRFGATTSFTLPIKTGTDIHSRFRCKLKGSIFSYHFENHFKMKYDGTIVLVPIIIFFEQQKNEQMIAFNIYDQTIHRIRNQAFYFEDFFENSEPYDSAYHGDVFVDEYIDNYILHTLDEEIRESLIVLPRERLSEKVDILSMYMI